MNDSRNLRDWAKALTIKFLKLRPNLEELRDDLEQEASLAILKASEDYSPDKAKGMDKGLYIWFIVRGELQKFVDRREKKHWLSQESDPESQYWDLEESPDPEAVPNEDPDFKAILWEALYGIEFTKKQQIVLESFLRTGTFIEARETLGVSAPTVSEIWGAIIKKARRANDLE